jgi:phage terminase large subunit-like protein
MGKRNHRRSFRGGVLNLADHLKRYCDAVLSGERIAGKYQRLSVERYREMRDRVEWSENAAQFSIDFFGLLKHSKGKWSGDTFEPSDWQRFVLANLFGFVRDDGTRAFRTAYTSVARKNGKSTFAAGLGLLMFAADGEGGGEIYSAATKRDQARITYDEASNMVKASPSLARIIRVQRHNLSIESTFSKFEPLSAEADKLDGLNPHGVLVDELHAHRTRRVWDVLATATGARAQPLMFAITTAGHDRASICWEVEDYSRRVLEGIIEDDTWFAMPCGLDDEDDWRDEAHWGKANPSLGETITLDYLRKQCKQAEESPGRVQAFRQLHCNQWTESSTRYFDMEKWDACGGVFDTEALKGRPCYAGLDLASTTDITALVLVFDMEDHYAVLPYFWIPQGNASRRLQQDRIPYPEWIERGLIESTPGTVTDYEYIRKRINELGQVYNIREIAVDRWNATQLVVQLGQDGFNVAFFGQGMRSMAAPTKELEALVLAEKLQHGENAVLRWMAANTTVERDAADNRKPSKSKSSEKIDGIVATIMALARLQADETGGKSVYHERGLMSL